MVVAIAIELRNSNHSIDFIHQWQLEFIHHRQMILSQTIVIFNGIIFIHPEESSFSVEPSFSVEGSIYS